jgi:hypothetical protein
MVTSLERNRNMKKMALISMVALVIVVTGCSDKYKKAEEQMN